MALTISGDITYTGNIRINGNLIIDNNLIFGDIGTDVFTINGYMKGNTGVIAMRDDTGAQGLNITLSLVNQQIASTTGDLIFSAASGQIDFGANALSTTGGGSLTGVWTDLGSVTTIDINGGTIDGTIIGGAAAEAGTFTTISQNNLTSWSAGAIVTAGSYQIGRDTDATNQLHFNVPTGASFEFSINDVAAGVLSASAFTLSNINLNVTTGAGIITRDGIATTSTDGLVLENTTNATALVPMQYSPRLRFHSEVWDTDGSNDSYDFYSQLEVASAATTTPSFTWYMSKNGAAASMVMLFYNPGNPNGKLQIMGGLQATDGIYLTVWGVAINVTGTGSIVQFSSATGRNEVRVGPTAGVAGVARGLDFAIPVTTGGAAGAELSYDFKIDNDSILKVYAETDGSGSYQNGKVILNKGIIGKQGTDIASASTIVIPTDGNVFELTGTTAVNLITTTGFQDGHEIILIANESVTINHATATSGSDVTILLAGAGNFAMTANDTLCLILSTTTAGGQAWREKSRTAI